MKSFVKYNVIISSLIILCILLLKCERPTSPYFNDYKGNYKLSAQWSTSLDTFNVLTPYRITYRSTGTDTFLTLKVITDPTNQIDTAFSLTTMTDSTIDIIFTSPFSGKVTVLGIQPNNKEVSFDLPVIVKNPFKLSGDKSLYPGQNGIVYVNKTAPESYTADWYINNTFIESAPTMNQFPFKSDTIGTYQIFAIIKDTSGHSIQTDTFVVNFLSKNPSVKFPQDSMDAPVNQEINISVQASNCDSIQWTVKKQGVNVKTVGSLKVTFTNEGTDTIIAIGQNKAGGLSTPDTLLVNAKTFNYGVQTVLFPDTIRAKHWTTWQVQAIENGTPVTGAHVIYEWEMQPDSIWDSIKTTDNGSQLHLLINDSIPTLMLKARAKIGDSDSTYWVSRTIVTRLFRPSCSIITKPFSTMINVDSSITVKAEESNSDGSISGIYYKTSDMLSPISTNGLKTWNLRFNTPGQKTVQCWCLDNDGFTSDTAMLRVSVGANHPYFSRPIIDTTVYVDDSIHILMQALPGNTLDTIKSYKWDFDNNGVYEKITSNGKFDTFFANAGKHTIKVECLDNRGDSGIATITINATNPTPSVLSIKPDSAYLNDPTNFIISAKDPRGYIKNWLVSWDSGQTFETKTDSVIAHSYSIPGSHTIQAFAINNKGISGDTINKAIFVKIGLPSITSISTDTAFQKIFINDPITFRLKGNDPRGKIDSLFVSWNGDTVFEQKVVASNDSASITHTWLKDESGNKSIVFRIKDNRGLTKDSTLSINVRPGNPVVDSVRIDTTISNVFVQDLRTFTVFASDSNGSIRVIYTSWNGGSTPDDSITVNLINKGSATITHVYDTSLAGNRTAKFWVKDNDSLMSNPKQIDLSVRLGAPVIWGNGVTKDTLYLIINNGYRDYYFRPHYFDTNGTIKRFYYGSSIDTSLATYKGQADSSLISIDGLNINKPAAIRYIYGRDDDEILRGNRFVIFADSAPRAISATYNNSQSKFQWSGLDAVDSLATSYRILIKFGSQILPGDTIASFIAKDWTPGNDASFNYNASNPLPFSWPYVPSKGPGLYYFQILARDKRGTITATQLSGTNFFSL